MSKIPLNGFGRIGKLAMAAHTLPMMNDTANAVFDEGIERERLRELERLDELPDPDANTYLITRRPEEPLVGPFYSLPTKAIYKHSDNQKSKDYAKKKKAKRRQQKQARRRNK
jgi:hypothetical protein